MRGKLFLRISIALNILLIAVFIFTLISVEEFQVTSSRNLEEEIREFAIKNNLKGEEIGTLKLKESDFNWPEGKKMALSFTFDDAAVSQIENGIPLFDKYGIKATFYVSLWDVEKRVEEWKKALKNGHEVGNHTRKHPCSVNNDFSAGNPLEDYSLAQIRSELYFENEVLKSILGVQPVSFAYPCGQTFVGRGLEVKSYVPLIAEIFETGRGYVGGFTNPVLCDMSQLPAEFLDGKSFEEIKALIDTARVSGKWLILAGHGIEEGDANASQISTIDAICKYAMDPSNGIWVDNVHNIASYVRNGRGETPFTQQDRFNKPLNLLYSKLMSRYYVLKLKMKDLKRKIV